MIHLQFTHMSTERPKVQGYLLPDTHKRFTEWKKSKGIEKDSEALNQLLNEYFMVNHSDLPVIHPVTEERMDVLEKKLNA